MILLRTNFSIPCLTLGSVNGANCKELAAKPDVDGFLVGGASLKVGHFAYDFVLAFWFSTSMADLYPYLLSISRNSLT